MESSEQENFYQKIGGGGRINDDVGKKYMQNTLIKRKKEK
jgi:hypothetical protein